VVCEVPDLAGQETEPGAEKRQSGGPLAGGWRDLIRVARPAEYYPPPGGRASHAVADAQTLTETWKTEK